MSIGRPGYHVFVDLRIMFNALGKPTFKRIYLCCLVCWIRFRGRQRLFRESRKSCRPLSLKCDWTRTSRLVGSKILLPGVTCRGGEWVQDKSTPTSMDSTPHMKLVETPGPFEHENWSPLKNLPLVRLCRNVGPKDQGKVTQTCLGVYDMVWDR